MVTVFRLRLAPRKIDLSQAERLRSGLNLQWFRFNAGVRHSLARRQRPMLLEYLPPTLIFPTPMLETPRLYRISASFCPDHASFSCQVWNTANAAATSAALSDAIVPSGRCLPSSNPTRVDQHR